jgi:Spy/CpxP family protein refolding chaperone
VVVMVVIAVAAWAGVNAIYGKADPKDAPLRSGERLQDLNLTDEQEAKIADIRKEFGPKVRDAKKDFDEVVKEEVEKVRGVLTPAQKSKVDADKEERQEHRAECLAGKMAHLEDLDLTEAEITKIHEIRKESHPKLEEALKQMHGFLSDDQKKAREDAISAGQKRKAVMQSLKLTDEQKEKMQTVGKEISAIVKAELEKFSEVFTAEQKEKLEDLKDERKERVHDRRAHRIANLKDLDLTDAQKSQIAEIRKEYRPKVHDAGLKLRGAIKEEVQAIVTAIKG